MPIVTADSQNIARAAQLLREGQLAAFPTETVYGLGANALDEVAVQRIYAAKGRPAYNPLIVHVPDIRAAREIVSDWPDAAQMLAEKFWPGPLTLVLPKSHIVPGLISAGLDSVAVRVPAHPVALELLRAAQIPLAAPSANLSTEVSPTTARHVEKSLGEAVTLILDGGACRVGIESTVLDLTGPRPAILRPGIITASELEAVIGPLGQINAPGQAEPRASPGMMDKHYAPRAPLFLMENVGKGRALLQRFANPGYLLLEHEPALTSMIVMPSDPTGYARRLYAALHELDEAGCDAILVQQVPNDPQWTGVRDRLRRAAS